MDKLKNYITLPIDKLVKADWNYKTDNVELTEKLKENIKRNGQVENIIVRELETGFYEVVNGNHRYTAMKELGESDIVCYNLGAISGQAAIRIAIETNETRFATDSVLLAERMKELTDEYPLDELVKTMPYSQEEIEAMQKLLDFDWDQYKGDGEAKSGDEEPKQKIALTLNVTPEAKERWDALVDLYGSKVEEDDESVIFEFAVGKALRELETSK